MVSGACSSSGLMPSMCSRPTSISMSRSNWRTVTSNRIRPSTASRPGCLCWRTRSRPRLTTDAAMNSGMTGSSAPTNWAVNATIIAKSAASWTARRGAIPAEGTGEGSWQHEWSGGGRGGRPGPALRRRRSGETGPMDTRPYDLVGLGDNLLWLSSPRKRTNRTQPLGLGFRLKENRVAMKNPGSGARELRPLFCAPGSAPGPAGPSEGRPPGDITKRPQAALP